ncbi:MAG: hypothetical protein IJA88_02150 [Clostridia bacterium]|nr:hypothetical protein [Clostridia bacterium]
MSDNKESQVLNKSLDDGVKNDSQIKQKGDKPNKIKKSVSIILSVILFIITFAGGFFTSYLVRGRNANVASDIVTMMEKVGYIYDPTTGEPRSITEKDVADALVNAILDKYSKYYTAEEYKKVQSTSHGNYDGVGVSFYSTEDLEVDQVILNSPFDRAGGKVGDLLVSATVDGQETTFTSVNHSLVYFSQIENGKEFSLKYQRDGDFYTAVLKKSAYVASYVYYLDDQKEFKFTSDSGTPTGKENSVLNSQITDSTVGYIRITGFEGGASSQLGSALEFMKTRGKTKLILDLRANGGGYMDVLCDIASYFIDNGGAKKSAVAISSGKTGNQIFYTKNNKFCSFIQKACILGDQDTASASECLIGAIVHYGDIVDGINNVIVEKNSRGVAKTYGKGIMQTTYMLVSGGAFKLTTAKILWPDAKTCIHDVGVTPKMGATEAEKGGGINKAIQVLCS